MFLLTMKQDFTDLSRLCLRTPDARRPPLTIKPAAEYLGVTVRFMKRLVSERRIAFYKMGGRILFSPDELDRYMQSCLTPVGGRGKTARNHG